MKAIRAILSFVLVACLLTTAARAEKRIALVIGNAQYLEVAPLANPTNDAAALSASLQRLGFEVLTGLDMNLREMRSLIRDFGKRVSNADVAMFFYAGHGVQVNGKNYLLPTDAVLEEEADLDFSAVEADLVMRQMESAASTRLVILDACRNNPFERALSRSMGATRSAQALGRGLARINASGGSMIAFATDPGAVAFDGDGRHSPFTQALLKHIETPGLEVNVMMTRVRADVYKATAQRQRPWTSSSLIGEVYLAPSETPGRDVELAKAPPSADASETALEIEMWRAAETGGSIADYNSYLNRFPKGAFAAMAGNRIAALKTAVEAPARTTPSAVAPTEPSAEPNLEPELQEQALELNRSARREVQERLMALGHDPRGLDGIFGTGSRSAIRAWQESAKLPATGYLNREALTRLKAASAEKWAALKAEQERRRAAEAKRRRNQVRQSQSSTSSSSTSGSTYRARATCGSIAGYGRHADRQQAMLQAARQCASKGGSPSCCTSNVTVSR